MPQISTTSRPSQPMRILHTVEFYSPSVGGAQEVVRQISTGLARRGHDVTVATTHLPERTTEMIDGVRVRGFNVRGNLVRGFKGDTAAYRRFLMEGDYDVVMSYAAQQWTADLTFDLLKRIEAARVFAPCGFSGLQNPEYRAYFQRLPWFLSQYEALIFHSQTYQDIRFAKEHELDNIQLIPNGCSEQEFAAPDTSFRQRHGIPQHRPLLLTVGSHTGGKGHSESIRAFLKSRIGPATLIVIGNQLGHRGCHRRCRLRAKLTRVMSYGQKQVLLLDPPRADVVSAFHAADLFVFPSNIECSPLVLFEAMASRTPFISTPVGNSEEIAAWSGSGRIAKAHRRQRDGYLFAEINDLAQSIEQLWKAPVLRQQMAESGYAAWKERFTWEHLVTRYESIYRDAIAARTRQLALRTA